MSLSKKSRFEVFKRDGFQCGYCGKTPPEVSLEVDHIEPKSRGGSDDINNLITACFDCNRGKSNRTLDKIPNQLNENLNIIKEKEEQLKEYRKYVLKVRKRIEGDINKVEKVFQTYFEDRQFTDYFRKSVKMFLEVMDLYKVMDAMDMACLRKDESQEALKYFCGICWNIIKNRSSYNG